MWLHPLINQRMLEACFIKYAKTFVPIPKIFSNSNDQFFCVIITLFITFSHFESTKKPVG